MHDNKRALLLASFFTLIAAGVGFGVRAGVLADWAEQFGFTQTELGSITGGGFVGFGIVIILSSLFVDKVGYKPLLILAISTLRDMAPPIGAFTSACSCSPWPMVCARRSSIHW